ncbi:DUF6056 family protein [Telluribacter sp.]|jgi:hypothetical protein|uniref:DUF6056 family protein n=1 Tax=Telluribacter sp. TaxID=1978767 RepID=UPI002E117C70|nr:DUF6056 family protein [Telluribacter sp.]
MNNLYTKYRVVGNWLNLALLGSVLLPLVVLSLYNHPSPADDYCYIDTVFNWGWLGAMHWYYIGWSGRYFGILLNHSNPLLFGWVEGFKVLPLLLLVGLTGSMYLLVRQLTPTLSRLGHAGFAGVLFFLYMLNLASIAEAFYWTAGFVTYTIPNILTLYWIVVVLRWYRLETRSMQIATGIFVGFLAFAIIGSSETNLVILAALIAGWWGYRLLFQRTWDGLMVSTAVVALFSCFLYARAPGNKIRMGGDTLSGNIPLSITSSFQKLAELTLDWFSLPLLLFSLAWVLLLARMSPQARTNFQVPLWYPVLLWLGLLVVQLFPAYYGIGSPAPRIINCVYLFFLVGWFYNLGVLTDYLLRRYSFAVKVPDWGYLALITALAITILGTFYGNINTRLLYKDWLSGKAAAFDREMYQRYDLIKASPDSVLYLPLLQNQPYTLFVEDIRPDSTYLWNKCLASYHGKKDIYSKEVTDVK